MRQFVILALFVTFAACTEREIKLDGAYRLIHAKYDDSTITQKELSNHTCIKIFKSGYWISASHYATPKIVVESSKGGTYQVKNGKYFETVTFSSDDNSIIGKTFSFDINTDENNFSSSGKTERYGKQYLLTETFEKSTSDNNLTDRSLEGVWERKSGFWNGNSNEDPDFFQFKICSYPSFIWAQFRAKSKDFIGMGGGTYSFDGKKLVEHLEYISYGPLEPNNLEINVTKFSPDSIQQETEDKTLREIWKKIK